MEEEFLADNNACGQTLLQLVSRGNAINAELLRLKDHIPDIFRLENKQDIQKYADVILDFTYFSNSESCDKKIEKSDILQRVDEEVREEFSSHLERFYMAYDGVYRYVVDLNSFIDDLEENAYIGQTLDTILLSQDGIQLLCESVYVYGVMLLILEAHHPGPVRERITATHTRYSITVGRLDQVCNLIRCTSQASGKRPPNYPIDYFRRVPLKKKLVEAVLGKLRTDDIYHQQKCLPLAEHSTTALAPQAGLLFVCLFFSPNTLNSQTARMREIVDKFFPDNWVVNVHMGLTMNIFDAWEGFKAAKTALTNVLDPPSIAETASMHTTVLVEALKETEDMLKEGALTKRVVTESSSKVLSLARKCNVTLRWLLLHTSPTTFGEVGKRCRTARDTVLADAGYNQESLLHLLLNTAAFENQVLQLFKTILDERSLKWSQSQKEATTTMEDLAEVFGGSKQIGKITKSESLRKWFSEMKDNIIGLSLDEANISARKIVQLVQALEEVQGYPAVLSNVQVREWLSEACTYLRSMLSAVSIRDSLVVQMQAIGDFSYGWHAVDSMTPLIQQWLTTDPKLLTKIRALFIKLSAAMETCLIRINQAGHEGDLSSVSLYYSGQLVSYAKRLLQVVAHTMFGLMAEIAAIQTESIPELPARLDKDKLRTHAALSARHRVSQLTHEVSVFSSGLANMESTLVGVVCLEPKIVLREGVISELASHIENELSQALTFPPKAKGVDVINRLMQLGNTMDGHQRSIEYIQDYINIDGTKMWQDEMRKVIDTSVEAECSRIRRSLSFLKSTEDPFSSLSFMGRLARQILLITDPKVTFYLESESAWFDLKTKQKAIDVKFFSTIIRAVGVAGLVGIQRIIGFNIVKILQGLVEFLIKESQNNKAWDEMFSSISTSLQPVCKTIDGSSKMYVGIAGRVHRLTQPLLEPLTNVGVLQLINSQISHTLHLTATSRARLYSQALQTLNEALVEEFKRNPEFHMDEEELSQVCTLLDWVGLSNPAGKIYITSLPVPHLDLVLFLFSVSNVSRFIPDKQFDCLTCKRTGETAWPLIHGMATLLKQFHPSVAEGYTAYCCQYIKSLMLQSLDVKGGDVPVEATCMLHFISEVGNTNAGVEINTKLHIPPPILDLFSSGYQLYVEK